MIEKNEINTPSFHNFGEFFTIEYFTKINNVYKFYFSVKNDQKIESSFFFHSISFKKLSEYEIRTFICPFFCIKMHFSQHIYLFLNF